MLNRWIYGSALNVQFSVQLLPSYHFVSLQNVLQNAFSKIMCEYRTKYP